MVRTINERLNMIVGNAAGSGLGPLGLSPIGSHTGPSGISPIRSGPSTSGYYGMCINFASILSRLPQLSGHFLLYPLSDHLIEIISKYHLEYSKTAAKRHYSEISYDQTVGIRIS